MSKHTDKLDAAAIAVKALNKMLGEHDAEFIVRAVESHEDLLTACERMLDLETLWFDENNNPKFRDTEGFNIAIQCLFYGTKSAIAQANKPLS